jgi:hypothetical protein
MTTNLIILGVTNALKSDATPGANESHRYREAGLSQQACAVSSETSSRLSCWNVEGAYSNLSCTVVMEEGRQKYKRLSYTAKFKHEFIRCAEKGQSRCNFWSWWKQRSTVVETQDSDQWVWGVTKEIHWTQERTISWNWWCSLHVFSRETQDWTFWELWSTSRVGSKEGQIFEHSSKSF